MDKIIQIIAICFLKSTTKGDSLNSYHPSNQAKKLLNNKELPKSLAVSFLFINFAPTFASCPTRLGFWANSVWLRICLYLWESVFMRFVSDSLKSGKPEPREVEQASVRFHASFINRLTLSIL